MHNIAHLLPLIDHYASFSRVQEVWGEAEEGTITGTEVVSGLVVKVGEAWDDTQGVPLYQGVEVHFDDASVLLIKPSDTWRLEAWGDLHEEAMTMLSALGHEDVDGEDPETAPQPCTYWIGSSNNPARCILSADHEGDHQFYEVLHPGGPLAEGRAGALTDEEKAEYAEMGALEVDPNDPPEVYDTESDIREDAQRERRED